MNIAFVTTYNARNVSNWSGLGYYISKSLEDNGNNMNYFGDLDMKIAPLDFFKKVYYTQIARKKYAIERTVATAKSYAERVTEVLSGKKFDCVFSPGSIPVAYLKTSLPKVMYMDATFDCMLDYYEPSSDLSSDIIRQGHELEKQALDSCALAIFSSDWAAQSAINYYGTSPSKVKVVPFGANFDVVNSEPQVKDIINIRDKHTLKILFNGVDWLRKGGDVVLSTVDELIKRGLQVELHVAGLHSIPISNIPHFVINHGYLKKGIPEEKEALENLYNTCHFLFLPSRAEAFGCVFCEASLFGMPSISRKTGGVPTSIINGKNGFALDQSAGVNDYADLICDLFLDKDKYTALAESSYEEYKNRLNWKTAGESLTQLMEQL